MFDTEPDSTREAVDVAPCIALNTIALAVSFFLKFAVPGSPYIFATSSNLAFLISAFYIQYRTTVPLKTKADDVEMISDSYLIANLSTCACIFLVLLGASSLAFHSESVLFKPLHSFDILFGWMLVLTVAFTSISTSFYAWAGRKLTRQLHSATFVGFMMCICALILSYDVIYAHQLEFYIPLACVAILASVVSRIILVGKRPNASTVGYAVGEILILIIMAVSAVFSQGELLGRHVTRENDADAYDLFHGIWHYLLASVCCIVFVRSLSVARMVEANYPVCVCKPSRFDILGEVALFVFASASLILKEANVDHMTSLIILVIVACALFVHAVILTCT
jgi:hypothetical protein